MRLTRWSKNGQKARKMPTNPTFQVPRDGLTYYQAILERSFHLIEYGIWGGLHKSTLKSWWANFSGDKEKYFAACLLDHLIYRSKDQTLALAEQLFQRVIPDMTRRNPTPIGPLVNLMDAFSSNSNDPGMRLVTAVRKRDPLTKSANEICRFFKRDFSFSENWIIAPWEIRDANSRGIEVFFFIDDFLGTGSQFTDLLLEENLDNSYLSTIYVAYTPLVAHTEGEHHLRTRFPNLLIKSVEVVDQTHNIFDTNSSCFEDRVNTPASAMKFYFDLLKKRRIPLQGNDRCGFGNLGLLYTFEHAAPDNSLPLLWWNEGGWTRLFAR